MPARLVLMALLVTAWAARLTFNFARKGGYTGMEDYRWAILRGRMKPWQFQVFNLLFIVLYQNALLVLITLPALIAWQNPAPLSGWDVVFAVLFAAFLVGEFVADQQQWDFHRAKAAAGGTPRAGFRHDRPVPPAAATRTSSSSRRSGGPSTRSARRRPRHPVWACGVARSTGRSSARRC